MMLAGRGAGKTRAGAEWVRARVERDTDPARFIALIGETYAAARALVVFDGEIWQALDVAAPASGEGGANLVRSVTSENPIGAALTQIPSHGIFLGLTAVVTQAIKGPARWSIGVDGGHDRFGNGLGVEAGTQICGPADPSVVYWEETPIIATPERGQFTAGRLKLSIFFIDLPVPLPVPEPDDN